MIFRVKIWHQFLKATSLLNKHFYQIAMLSVTNNLEKSYQMTIFVFFFFLKQSPMRVMKVSCNNFRSMMLYLKLGMTYNAWKVSNYGVFSGSYFLVFGLNAGKYGPGKTPFLTLFTQWYIYSASFTRRYCSQMNFKRSANLCQKIFHDPSK